MSISPNGQVEESGSNTHKESISNQVPLQSQILSLHFACISLDIDPFSVESLGLLSHSLLIITKDFLSHIDPNSAKWGNPHRIAIQLCDASLCR